MGKSNLVKNCFIFFIGLGLLYYLLDIWLALFVSIVLGYCIYPFANWIYVSLLKTGIKKELCWNLSCSIAFVVFMTLILVLVILFIPICIHQIQMLISFLRNIKIDEIWGHSKLLPFYENVYVQGVLKLIKPNLNKIIDTGINQIVSIAQRLTHNSGTLITSFFSSFHNLFYSFLVLVLSFHLLRDRFKWEKRLIAFLSEGELVKYRERIVNSVNIFTESMKYMVTGQFIITVIMSLYYGAAFILTGFSPFLGLVFSSAAIFPYLGDTIAFALLIFDALSRGFIVTKFLSAVILIGIGHNISSHLLAPILIGNYTGVLPVQILFGLMLHVHTLGPFGLVFNIPLSILERSIFAFWRSDLIGDKNKKST